MSMQHVSYMADLSARTTFIRGERRTVASYQHELASMKVQLKAALDREASLLRQRSELIQLRAASNQLFACRKNAKREIGRLTPRQREIMELVLAGHPSKNIAADLGISQRTVENRRAAIMHKTCSKSLPALTRLALAAASSSCPINKGGLGCEPSTNGAQAVFVKYGAMRAEDGCDF
jgi:DNA-binding NarL/FixJ family response regulator